MSKNVEEVDGGGGIVVKLLVDEGGAKGESRWRTEELC